MNRAFGILAWVLISICVLVAMTLISICFAIATKGVEKDKIGDIATWFGAFGAICTLIGTVRIAYSQDRKLHRERRLRSAIVSPGIAIRIQYNLFRIEVVLKQFEGFIVPVPINEKAWSDLVDSGNESLEQIDIFDLDVLEIIGAVDQGAARKIYLAQSLVLVLREFVYNMEVTPIGKQQADLGHAIKEFRQIFNVMSSAHEDVNKFALQTKFGVDT